MAGRRKQDDPEGKVSLLTKDSSYAILAVGGKPSQEESESLHMLAPLLEGRSVVLQVLDPTMVKKKRIGTPVLIISPMAHLGVDTDALLFALEGGGAEILDTKDIKVTALYRTGLTLRAAKLLKSELNKLFNVRSEGHGKRR